MSEVDFGRAAIAYRRLGWPIIPCDGKKALIKWRRYTKVLPTEEETKSWWERHPGANLGLIVGEISGFVVLDIDDIAYFYDRGLELPQTPKVKSGGRGEHLYFKLPSVNGMTMRNHKELVVINGRTVEMFSLRCKNQYVVIPPSVHPDTNEHYRWVEEYKPWKIPPPDLPPWALELLLIDPKKSINEKHTYANHSDSFRDFIEELKSRINLTDLLLELGYKGERHQDYSSFFCPFHDDGQNPDFVVWDNLCGTYDYHDDQGYDVISLVRKLRGWDFRKTVTWLCNRTKIEPPKDFEPEGKALKVFKSYTVSELRSLEIEQYQFIVEDIVEKGGVTVISGDPGVGKSFLCLEISKAVIMGEPLLGIYQTQKGAG